MAPLIAAQREARGIPCAVSCRALGVSRSWFYKHKRRELPPRAARRERLKAEVGRLFGLHEGKYGSSRITADLKDAGWRVNACAPHSRHPSGPAVIYTRAEVVAFLAGVYNGGSMTCARERCVITGTPREMVSRGGGTVTG